MFLGNAITTENCPRLTFCVADAAGVSITSLTTKLYSSTTTLHSRLSKSLLANNDVHWQNTRQNKTKHHYKNQNVSTTKTQYCWNGSGECWVCNIVTTCTAKGGGGLGSRSLHGQLSPSYSARITKANQPSKKREWRLPGLGKPWSLHCIYHAALHYPHQFGVKVTTNPLQLEPHQDSPLLGNRFHQIKAVKS